MMPGIRARVLLLLLIASAAVATAGLWLLRPRPSDEDLILDLVERAEHGIETKNVDEIMACVSPDYSDEAGLTRLDLHRAAFRWQRTSEQVEIEIGEYHVVVEPPRAVGEFGIELVFWSNGRSEGPFRLPLRVEFEQRRRGWRKVWLVRSVSGHGVAREAEGLF